MQLGRENIHFAIIGSFRRQIVMRPDTGNAELLENSKLARWAEVGKMALQTIGGQTSRPAGKPEDPVLDLRLLATSDLHANLLAWDYHANRVCDHCGLSRVASLIGVARSEQPQSLLFDNGDFLNGTVLGDYLAETTPTVRSGRPIHAHPIITAMNALRYDAVTLGNHEFGHGLGYLRRSLAATRFPVVCSNLYFKPTRGAALSLPYVILDRLFTDRSGKQHGLKIGVLGFLPPQTMIWERRYLKSRASVESIVRSAQTLLPNLRDAGADLVIALSHSGIGEIAAGPGAENASSALAQLDGIDAVIAGHTHQVFPTAEVPDLHGKPVVMPGFHGSHLGVIDLTLARGSKGWRVLAHNSCARPISHRDPVTTIVAPLIADDPEIAAIAMPAHQTLIARVDRQIGFTHQPLHSFFALVHDSAALRLVADAQTDRLKQVLAGSELASLPMVSAVAPFKAGGRGGADNYTDIPAGPLRLRHVSDLYVHPNSLSGLRVSGRDLALWLERSASLYRQITAGAVDAMLIDDRFPSFNFDVIYGLTYQIDLSQPAQFDPFGKPTGAKAPRIVNLTFAGKSVTPEQKFVLATNSYRAAGGAGFAGTVAEQVIYEGKEGNREVLERYLQNGATAPATPMPPTYSFLPMPGETVLFDTAPSATEHLQDVPHLRPEPLGLQPDGFRRFRLHL